MELINFKNYLSYQFFSKGDKFLHSPFLYRLHQEVFFDDYNYYPFLVIEAHRKHLLKTNKIIEVTDFGVGSRKVKSNKRKISSIASTSLMPSKYARLLFRLKAHLKAKNILELGTSLGVTSSYLAFENKKSKINTLEGCPEIAKHATSLFNKLQINNIHLKLGNFNQTLDQVLSPENKLDFVIIDGNHHKEAVLNYTERIIPFLERDAVVVIDDINWSKGMHEAWKDLITNPNFSLTLDLNRMGIMFTNHKLSKEHFTLRY